MSDLLQQQPKVLAMTAAEVRRALKAYYPHPNFGILYEVAQATGFNANRHLDAMAMGLWPSRGLHLNGIEIKVSRADFRREIEQPQKAEELAKYCDYFFVAAPRGVVPVAEVPEKWGLLEVLETGKIRETKAASKHDALPPHRNLMAALFRAAMRPAGADDIDAAVSAAKAALEAKFRDRVEEAVKRRNVDNEHDAEAWRKLRAIVTDERWADEASVLAAVAVVYKSGVARSYQGLASLQSDLRGVLTRIESAMQGLSVDEKQAKA